MSLDNTCHALSWSRLVWSWNVPVFTFFMPCIAVLWYSQNWAEIFHIWRTCCFLFPFQKHQAANCCLQQHIFRSCTKSHIFVSWNMHKKQWCIWWWVLWVSTLLPWQGPLQIASGRFLSQFLQICLFKQISCWTTEGKEIQMQSNSRFDLTICVDISHLTDYHRGSGFKCICKFWSFDRMSILPLLGSSCLHNGSGNSQNEIASALVPTFLSTTS